MNYLNWMSKSKSDKQDLLLNYEVAELMWKRLSGFSFCPLNGKSLLMSYNKNKFGSLRLRSLNLVIVLITL